MWAGKGRVMEKCEFLSKCAFYRTYAKSPGIAWKGFVTVYCLGSRQKECKRKEFFTCRGTSPPQNMLPSGQLLPEGLD